MNEKPLKSRAGRPLGSTKPKVSVPLFKLSIEVSPVQFKQLQLMVESGVGKSIQAIIEALLSAELMKRRDAGKIGPEATILPFENKEENAVEKNQAKISPPNTTSAT
jgi:hypothetical protein